MSKRLLVFQSLWAMQQQPGPQPVEQQLTQLAAAGFDGFTDHYVCREHVRRLSLSAAELGLQAEGQVFPTTVDELNIALELGSAFGCHHITIQADLRPRTVREAVAILQGWQRLAEQVDFPVLLETHRYRLNNDLLFTLDLLEQLPKLQLLADLSHYVVARELPCPPSPQDEQHIQTILAHSWGFHGRVSNGQQVQVPLRFAQHQPWVQVFRRWWRDGMRNWLQRARPEQTLSFTCELGPAPYAITGADGRDLVDRWQESLYLKSLAEASWQQAVGPD